MGTNSRRRKAPGLTRRILAENLRTLMARHYATSWNKPVALSKDSGAGASSIQRILDCQVGASIDTVEALARALQTSVPELLTHASGKPSTAPQQPPTEVISPAERAMILEVARRLESPGASSALRDRLRQPRPALRKKGRL